MCKNAFYFRAFQLIANLTRENQAQRDSLSKMNSERASQSDVILKLSEQLQQEKQSQNEAMNSLKEDNYILRTQLRELLSNSSMQEKLVEKFVLDASTLRTSVAQNSNDSNFLRELIRNLSSKFESFDSNIKEWSHYKTRLKEESSQMRKEVCENICPKLMKLAFEDDMHEILADNCLNVKKHCKLAVLEKISNSQSPVNLLSPRSHRAAS